jgi:hypothetical protein
MVMSSTVLGTFHFHSTYSHDGRSTLAEVVAGLQGRGFGFCIMTEHFEDFTPSKFQSYLEETQALTRTSGFVLVPGLEVNLEGIDTILFPVTEFGMVERFAKQHGSENIFSVLAHPSKYPAEKVAQHLDRYCLSGVELWNQQADSDYRPPLDFLGAFRGMCRWNQMRCFFGCDLHDVNLRPSNLLALDSSAGATAEGILAELSAGRFTSRNLRTGIELDNRLGPRGVEEWTEQILRRGSEWGGVRWRVRQVLRSGYRLLPRSTRRGLNDFKNLVRNRI